MENNKHQTNWLGRIGSYLLVAALSAAISLAVYARLTKIRPLTGAEKLAEIQDLIDNYYIGEADPTDLMDGAAAGMVAGTGDKWAYYVSVSEMQSYEQSKENRYVGIGITIANEDNPLGFPIIAVEPDGPAMQAGILPGDILSAANGHSAAEMGIDGSAGVIGGEPGTNVTITVLRPTDSGEYETLEFDIRRETILVQVAKYTMLEDNVGYIRIANFNTNCAKQTIAAIEDLKSQGATALVFDVRFNGGGYKHELVELLDYLLPEGDLFISEDYSGAREIDTSDSDCVKMPMAVLVNQDSYSAAEFFAAALEEYDWAILGGSATSGKGHFQSTFTLSDGSAVNLSIGKYYTPNRVSLSDVGGLVPQYAAEMDEASQALLYSGLLEPQDDVQLQKVLSALKIQLTIDD